MKTLDIVMNGLMRRYADRVPNVNKITEAMISHGIIKNKLEIENDHVAFRTMGVENLGIASFEKIFMHLGYEKKDYFYFEGKKLNAFWYAPPSENYPRIFLSELRVGDLSTEVQETIKLYTDTVISDPVDALDLDDGEAIDAFLHKPLWQTPSWEHYEKLSAESEYAAWVIYNRYYLNHYTISLHNLDAPYDNIYKFNDFLGEIGIKLNDSGGTVKTSPDGGLLQSSTVAEMIDAKFSSGDTHSISGSYVEFAERKILPAYATLPANEIKRIHRRDGFETNNADKIFESTFATQTGK